MQDYLDNNPMTLSSEDAINEQFSQVINEQFHQVWKRIIIDTL